MGCFSCLSKVFLIVFNIAFFLAGLVPLVFGSIALANEELLKDIIDGLPGFRELGEIVDVNEFFKSFGIPFVVIGSIIVVVAFLGCCGALCNNKIMLGVYLGVITLAILAEIAIIIIAAAFPDTFNSIGEDLMEDGFENITDCTITIITRGLECGTSVSSKAWNSMQLSLGCCGYSGILDYNNTVGEVWTPRRRGVLAPTTCCKGVGGTIDKPDLESEEFLQCYNSGTSLNEYNLKGCFDVLIEEAVSSAIFIAVLSVLGAIEIILVIATIVALCKRSKGKEV